MKTQSLLKQNFNLISSCTVKTKNILKYKENHLSQKVTFHNPNIISKATTKLKSTSQRDIIIEETNLNEDSKVFVVGATGQTGKIIVEKLKERPEVSEIKAFVKDEAKGQKLIEGNGEKIKIVKGNLEDIESIKSSIKGCTAIINAAGTKDFLLKPLSPYLTEYEGIKNLISAAKIIGGIRKIVHISSIGVGEENVILSLAFYGLFFFKRRGEQEIQRSGIDYTIIRPSGLKNEKNEKRIIMSKKGTFGFGRDKKRTFGMSISRENVAECCIEALNLKEASNKIVEIVGDENAEKKEYKELFGNI